MFEHLHLERNKQIAFEQVFFEQNKQPSLEPLRCKKLQLRLIDVIFTAGQIKISLSF